MKKIVALLLVALMLSTAVFAGEMMVIAPNPNAGKTVTVQIEGTDGNLFYGKVKLEEGDTALQIAEKAFVQGDLTYTVSESLYGGSYISQAAGLQEGAFGGYEGWLYYVDGISPPVSLDMTTMTGGEHMVLIYADFDVLVPILEASRDDKGLVTLTVTADVTTYDENWNATVSRQPVADAALTVEGQAMTTDAQGKVLLDAALSEKEALSVQIGKKSAVGLPAVIPFAPDYTVDLTAVEAQEITFSDVEQDAWYAPYVHKLAKAGVVTGFEDGTFRPAETVTRAQVAKMLYALSGSVPVNYLMTFSDVDQNAWYAEAVRWAASQKIVTGFEDGTFRPDAPVTRQDLAVMLVRYQQTAGVELAADAAAPAFADNDKIAPYAAEAVYVLQKAGVVNGTDGKFNPTANAGRGELCKMMSAFVISD